MVRPTLPTQSQLTIEDHHRAAELIAQVNAGLRGLLRHLAHRRGVQAKVLDEILRADRAVQLVRSRLEDVAYQQLGAAGAKTRYYADPPAETAPAVKHACLDLLRSCWTSCPNRPR